MFIFPKLVEKSEEVSFDIDNLKDKLNSMNPEQYNFTLAVILYFYNVNGGSVEDTKKFVWPYGIKVDPKTNNVVIDLSKIPDMLKKILNVIDLV